jgi:hypothetical protein
MPRAGRAAPPPHGNWQRALTKAQEAKRRRADFLDEVKRGSLTLEDVFARAQKDDVVALTKIVKVLQALPGTGKVKANRAMELIGIGERRNVRGVGANQRERLISHFDGTAP